MDIAYNFNRKPTCLRVLVKVNTPSTIVIRVLDANKRNTVFEDRFQKINKEDVFYIKMPTSPNLGVVQIFNQKNGNLGANQDKTFMFNIKEVPLKRYIIPMNINNKLTRDFVRFAQEFSEDASIISGANKQQPYSIYTSDDGKLKINLHENLYDLRKKIVAPNGALINNRNYGRMVTTPMRTNAENGTIEVGKNSMVNYTVPMRVAILLHEYSHFYLNNRPEDEEEADRNALLIFLFLGYSKISAYKSFCEVFKKADSPSNRLRDEKIKDFINNFESNKYTIID